jgi:DNA modification methylase
LDPFCGSGTVALEASMAGRPAYVADANPMALLLTRVKSTPYCADALVTEAMNIVKKARRYRTAPMVNLINPHLWYRPERKSELERLLRAVDEVEPIHHREFFQLCFSVTARRLSLADPVISVPVRLKPKPTFDAKTNSEIKKHLRWIAGADHLEEFCSVCMANIQRVAQTNQVFSGRATAVQVGTDARYLMRPHSMVSMQGESVPLIITSPPYGSAQKYVRAMSLSLNWLGLAGPEELTSIEAKTIGREHLPGYVPTKHEPLPRAYETLLKKVDRTNPARARITRQYLLDLRSAVREIARVTCKGGRIVFIVGNNLVSGRPLQTDKFIASMLDECGLSLEMFLHDKIKSRGLMTKRNATASVIAHESVIVFHK